MTDRDAALRAERELCVLIAARVPIQLQPEMFGAVAKLKAALLATPPAEPPREATAYADGFAGWGCNDLQQTNALLAQIVRLLEWNFRDDPLPAPPGEPTP